VDKGKTLYFKAFLRVLSFEKAGNNGEKMKDMVIVKYKK